MTALSAILLYTLVPGAPAESSQTSSALPASRSSLPSHLRIPRIHVDALIEQTGLTPEGLMGAPAGPRTVAWYTGGPRPGEIGSAVIDGHSGWKDAAPAVFDALHTLQAGDKIQVLDSSGSTTTFTVREIQLYDPTSSATRVFHSNDGKSHLNLITCEGVWDPATQSSPKRLVIFSDKDTEIL